MKTLSKNFASTLYNNLNEVNFVSSIRKGVTVFYNDTPDQPTHFLNDEGNRVLLKDVINVSDNDTNLYIEVLNDLVVLYKPNKTERRYVPVYVFDIVDYKNATALSMAIALKIMNYYNNLFHNGSQT